MFATHILFFPYFPLLNTKRHLYFTAFFVFIKEKSRCANHNKPGIRKKIKKEVEKCVCIRSIAKTAEKPYH